jgi:hypothetical protein
MLECLIFQRTLVLILCFLDQTLRMNIETYYSDPILRFFYEPNPTKLGSGDGTAA